MAITSELARIGTLDAGALRALWSDWFDTSPPARMRVPILALALAYRIQSKTLGGLSKAAARTLDAVAAREFGAQPDRTLIRALARARRWWSDLTTGVHASVDGLAAAYKTNPHYIARHLTLAHLAPTLVEAILEGRQPVELTTWDLLNRIALPLDWTDQVRRLGFEHG